MRIVTGKAQGGDPSNKCNMTIVVNGSDAGAKTNLAFVGTQPWNYPMTVKVSGDQVRQRILLRHFRLKNERFTKTGSGQTWRNLEKLTRFLTAHRHTIRKSLDECHRTVPARYGTEQRPGAGKTRFSEPFYT